MIYFLLPLATRSLGVTDAGGPPGIGSGPTAAPSRPFEPYPPLDHLRRRGPMRLIARLLTCLLPFLPVSVREACGHPAGTSRIFLELGADSVEVKVDMNTGDILNLADGRGFWNATPGRVDSAADLVGYYLGNRLSLKADGRELPGRTIKRWSKDARTAEDRMDSLDLEDTTMVLTLGWPLPADARRL